MAQKWYFHRRVPVWRPYVLALLLIVCGLLVAPVPAAAQLAGSLTGEESDNPFAALLTQRGPSAVRLSSDAPQLYETTEGDERFVFQALSGEGRIRFPCPPPASAFDDPSFAPTPPTLECELLNGRRAEEVFVLEATRSPRGDVIYKDQEGQPVLRVTSNGGATFFAMSHQAATITPSLVPRGGKAVLPVPVRPLSLDPPALRGDEVEARMRLASDILMRRHGFLLTFIVRGQERGDGAVLADAVLTVAKGVDLVASDDLGRRYLSERLNQVQFSRGPGPDLDLDGGILTVTYVPDAGVSGRPSSLMVARFLERRL